MADFYDLKEVLIQASGKWNAIYSALAGNAVGHMLDNTRKRYTCPVHGTSNPSGKGDGFGFFKDFSETGGVVCNTCGEFSTGTFGISFLLGQEQGETIAQIAKYLGVKPKEKGKYVTRSNGVKSDAVAVPRINSVSSTLSQTEKVKITDKLKWHWDSAEEIGEYVPEPMAKWFKRKGCLLSADDLRPVVRFKSQAHYYKDSKPVATYFMMIIAARDVFSGEIITIHRTYLTYEGNKAPVDDARKTTEYAPDAVQGNMGVVFGTPIPGVEIVAEGLESALAVRKRYGLPIRVLLTSSVLRHLNVDPSVSHVISFTDRDASCSGEIAFDAMEEKLGKSCRCYSILPPLGIPRISKGIDFSDLSLLGDEFFLSEAALEKITMQRLFDNVVPQIVEVTSIPETNAVNSVGRENEELEFQSEVLELEMPVCSDESRPVTQYQSLQALDLWDSGLSITYGIPKPVKAALGAVNLLPEVLRDIRFLESLAYAEAGERIGDFPCILFAIRNAAGALMSVLRYYITEEGRPAPVSQPWKYANAKGVPVNWTSAAMRIGEVDESTEVQLIATDVLSALCIYRAYRLPVRVLRPEDLPEFSFNSSVKKLLVFVGKDENQAEIKLAQKAARPGREVLPLQPNSALVGTSQGVRWSDEVNSQGIFYGLPLKRTIVRYLSI